MLRCFSRDRHISAPPLRKLKILLNPVQLVLDDIEDDTWGNRWPSGSPSGLASYFNA